MVAKAPMICTIQNKILPNASAAVCGVRIFCYTCGSMLGLSLAGGVVMCVFCTRFRGCRNAVYLLLSIVLLGALAGCNLSEAMHEDQDGEPCELNLNNFGRCD